MPNPNINRRASGGAAVAVDLCAYLFLIPGSAGDSFECYLDGVNLQGLSFGGGFSSGGWQDNPLWEAIQAIDSFDSYSGGVGLDGLAGEDGWSAAWVDSDNFASLVADDSFDGYADDAELNGLAGGIGFSAAWLDGALDA
jgi:hypothetical protein